MFILTGTCPFGSQKFSVWKKLKFDLIKVKAYLPLKKM